MAKMAIMDLVKVKFDTIDITGYEFKSNWSLN